VEHIVCNVPLKLASAQNVKKTSLLLQTEHKTVLLVTPFSNSFNPVNAAALPANSLIEVENVSIRLHAVQEVSLLVLVTLLALTQMVPLLFTNQTHASLVL
jgi:hypothetical protein